MALSTKESMLLDAFEVTIVDINSIDPAQLQALSIAVGWPHRSEDWEFLRSVGQGIATIDKIGRVAGSTMWFPYGEHFATIGMVITTPRLQSQGAGRWLMEHVLQRLEGRALGLNSTAAALRLYVSLGFTIRQPMFQHEGFAAAPPEARLPAGARVRAFRLEDLDDIVELDRRAFDADRGAMLARLANESTGQVLEREDGIQAFSLCRAFGRGLVIGPVVAGTDEDAIAVTRPHIADHVGHFLRVDTRERSGPFPRFLDLSGMSAHPSFNSTMWMGRPWPITRQGAASSDTPITYGLASHTLS